MTLQLNGVFVHSGEITLSPRWIDAQDDRTLADWLRLLAHVAKDEDLRRTEYETPAPTFRSIQEWLTYKQQQAMVQISQAPKPLLLKERRREFQRIRAEVQLALIARDGYVCSQADCEVLTDLTIDHVVPVSKGGTDALENLRWLCRPHNSTKHDH